MNTAHDLTTANVSLDAQDLPRRGFLWQRFAQMGALLALASSTAIGCVAADATEEAADEEITSEADQNLYGNYDYWSKSSDGVTYIPVCWTFSGYDTDKAYVRSAVEGQWAGISSVKFTGWGTCTTSDYSSAVIRISQSDSTPQTNRIGTSSSGVNMTLNFTYSSWNSYTNQNCNCPPYDAACVFHSKSYYLYNCDYCSGNHEYCNALISLHEFGHALGFYHEQVRPENANSEYCDQWQSGETTVNSGDKLTSSYDTSSIMDYCSEWDRSKPDISSGDIEGMVAAYGSKPNKLTHQVLLYKDTYYQGSTQALYPGSYNVGDLDIGNDALSSIRVPSGWSVRLYVDSNYGGSYIDLTGDVDDLGDKSFDNKASSIVVSGPSETFPVIYKDGSYSGTSQTLRPGLYDVGDLTVGNDAVSSISIPSGWTITLYENSGFSGSTYSFTSSVSSLSSYSWNDKASSIRVEGPADRSPVMIFKDANYTGSAQALWPGRYNASDLSIGNDALTSLVVPSGWNVWLINNSDYWGSYVQYTSSQSSVSGDSFNDKASSIVVQGPTN